MYKRQVIPTPAVAYLTLQKKASAGVEMCIRDRPTGARKLFHAPAEGICKTHPRRVGVLIKSFIRLAPPEVITN